MPALVRIAQQVSSPHESGQLLIETVSKVGIKVEKTVKRHIYLILPVYRTAWQVEYQLVLPFAHVEQIGPCVPVFPDLVITLQTRLEIGQVPGFILHISIVGENFPIQP